MAKDRRHSYRCPLLHKLGDNRRGRRCSDFRNLNNLCLPESVDVAVFVDCHRLSRTCTYYSFRNIIEIDAYATVLQLHIYKYYVVLRSHGVRNTSDINPDLAVIYAGDNRQMLFAARILCSRDKLLHLLSAAYNRYFRIVELHDHVAAMAAFVEFCCHNNMYLVRTKFRSFAMNYKKLTYLSLIFKFFYFY